MLGGSAARSVIARRVVMVVSYPRTQGGVARGREKGRLISTVCACTKNPQNSGDLPEEGVHARHRV